MLDWSSLYFCFCFSLGDVGKELKNLITLMDQEEAEERRQNLAAKAKASAGKAAAASKAGKSPAKVAAKKQDRESPV